MKNLNSLSFLAIVAIVVSPVILFVAAVSERSGLVANTDWFDRAKSEFVITTAEQIAGLAALVNSGNDMSGITFVLGANISLNDTQNWQVWQNSPAPNVWTAIGTQATPFKGVFDGAGFDVSGVFIASPNADNVGFFGFVDKDGLVKNLSISSSVVLGRKNVGLLVGNNNAQVENCSSDGIVSGKQSVGSIVGYNSGEIRKSKSAGSVIGKGGKYFGGFVGGNDQGKIFDCRSSANLSGKAMFGGSFVGGNDGEINNSFSSGAVVSRGMFSGGFVGANTRAGTVVNSEAK